MQKINSNMLMAPILSALLVSMWSGIETGMTTTAMLVFFMWSMAGAFSLIVFAFPLILLVRKKVTIILVHSFVISLISAELTTLLISVLIPGRHPWFVSFNTMSHINIPCSIVAGFVLWYFGFRKVNA